MVREDFLPKSRKELAGAAAEFGLRQFPKRTEEERRSIMGSNMRLKALQDMRTTAWPKKLQAEMKRHVALAVQEQRLISDDALKHFPCVYIGSGGDIEYPLAIGARKIVLVDPACGLPRFRERILERIEDLTGERIASDATPLQFAFDFGSGSEAVTLELFAGEYVRDRSEEDPDMPLYKLPEKIGSILLFAAQGPSGRVSVDELMRERLVPGGAILNHTEVIRKDPETGEEQILTLGQEPK